MNQKAMPAGRHGFSQFILIVIVGAVLVFGGVGFWYYQKPANQQLPVPQTEALPTSSSGEAVSASTEQSNQSGQTNQKTTSKTSARDDLGCFPPSCSVIPDPQGKQICLDWKANKSVTWPSSCGYFSGQPACQKLCEAETKTATQDTDSQTVSTSTAVPCNLAPLQRQFSNTPYYSGPLFDAHFHMPQMFKIPNNPDAPVIDEDVPRRDVACLFSNKDRIKNVFAFYGIPINLKDQAVVIAQDIEKKYPGTMSPFIELVTFPGYPVVPSSINAVLIANQGLFKGYGELSLYLPHYNGVDSNDPAMRELYTIAQKNHLIVMVHLTASQQQSFEKVLQDFPNTIFLLHAAEDLPWASTVFGTYFDKYPNFYYSVDIDLVKDAVFPATTKADFIARMKQNWQTMLNAKVAEWKSKIEKYPNRFLWGTDRGHYAWHYDPEVEAYFEEFGRAFIGQLDSAAQEKYAHKNAESLLQKR